jgi:predicted dehydrogenase
MAYLSIDRRQFLKTAGAGAAAVSMTDLGVALAEAATKGGIRKGRILKPDQKLRLAAVGCGGKGHSDIMNSVEAGAEVVALCDADLKRGMDVFKKFPEVPKYRDFRKMLIEMDDKIDAVTVSTPDHMHFPAAMMAISMGKHVYVQKPLAHTIWEARTLTEAARKHQVITQMGNQGHAGEGIRLVREWIQSGGIGDVHEVHIWCNRPIWPQGPLDRGTVAPVPETLDWNAWLGVAPYREYTVVPVKEGGKKNDRNNTPSPYLPFKWRGWWDYGCGALGDMACHQMDAAFWGLDLKYPISVEATSEGCTEDTAPLRSKIIYKFPKRGKMPPLTLYWYDGDNSSQVCPRPKGLEENRKMPSSGQYIVGEKGTIFDTTDYCQSPRLIPETAMQAFKRPPKTIPRVPQSNPHLEWITACHGGPKPGSNFDYSGPFAETVLLGNLAIRVGKKVLWDGKNMRADSPEAQKLVRKAYREF